MNIRLLLILLLLSLGRAESVESQKPSEKVVLITGASRGIGLATAQILAESGFRVYATSRHPTPSSFQKKETLSFLTLDLKDPESISSIIHKIIKEEGRIDVLINNAGYN